MRLNADVIMKQMLDELGVGYKREYKFIDCRRWRFDYAILYYPRPGTVYASRAYPCKIAIEVEGGNFVSGRHTRGAGYEKDCEKYNMAQALGWYVIRFTPNMLQRDHEGCKKVLKMCLER